MKMYILTIVLILAALFFPRCKHVDKTKTVKKSTVKTILFKQQTTNKYTTWLELKQDKDFVSGTIYSVVDILYGIPPLFYKSKLENLEIRCNQIEFSLKKYQFSNKAFEPGRFNQALIEVDTNKVLMPDYYFFGKMSSDTLFLNRTCDYHDSKSDAFTFVKASD